MKKEEYYKDNPIEVEVIEDWIWEVIKLIPDCGQKILDIGCGEGTYSALLKKGENEVWGLEISDKSASSAQYKIDKVIIQDIEMDWKVPSDYFDIVVMLRSLEHIFDYNFQLQEANRVLKNNGSLLIFSPNMSIIERIRLLFGFCPIYADNIEHLRQFTKPYLFKILSENSFVPIYCKGWTFTIPKIRLRIQILEKTNPNFCTGIIIKAVKK